MHPTVVLLLNIVARNSEGSRVRVMHDVPNEINVHPIIMKNLPTDNSSLFVALELTMQVKLKW